ncbi:hypothetical protein I4U23_029429 [Adineta vaga]|nr:hypothetical protein I4U23_029429 [Adineta vaga]
MAMKSERFIGYIKEWTIVFSNSALKSIQFRDKLNNPWHTRSNKGIYNILQNYDKGLFGNIKQDLRNSLSQAVEDNDARYLIRIYTSSTSFSRVLNEHLATYGLHYFDETLQENVDYRLVKCVVDFITMLYSRPEFNDYEFKGVVYRGMGFEEESELYKYVVGAQIMNSTFLSASRDKAVAQLYSSVKANSLYDDA